MLCKTFALLLQVILVVIVPLGGAQSDKEHIASAIAASLVEAVEKTEAIGRAGQVARAFVRQRLLMAIAPEAFGPPAHRARVLANHGSLALQCAGDTFCTYSNAMRLLREAADAAEAGEDGARDGVGLAARAKPAQLDGQRIVGWPWPYFARNREHTLLANALAHGRQAPEAARVLQTAMRRLPGVASQERALSTLDLALFARLEELYDLALQHAGGVHKVEGNVYTHHQEGRLTPLGIAKLRSLQVEARRHTQVLEVGFNAGHSLATMLHGNRSRVQRVLAFDLNEHRYVMPCLARLRSWHEQRGVRIGFVAGNSTVTLPQVAQDHPELRSAFTLLHIDGGHAFAVALADIQNARSFAAPGATLIIDDCFAARNATCLGGAVAAAIQQRVIEIVAPPDPLVDHVFAQYIREQEPATAPASSTASMDMRSAHDGTVF